MEKNQIPGVLITDTSGQGVLKCKLNKCSESVPVNENTKVSKTGSPCGFKLKDNQKSIPKSLQTDFVVKVNRKKSYSKVFHSADDIKASNI